MKFFLFSSILVTAFVGTALAFGCFSAAAMLARRREYLYLGGLLSSGLSVLLWLHFASAIFGGSTAIFKFEVRRLIIINLFTFFILVIRFSIFAYWNRWWQLSNSIFLDPFCSCTLGFCCLSASSLWTPRILLRKLIWVIWTMWITQCFFSLILLLFLSEFLLSWWVKLQCDETVSSYCEPLQC